MSKVGEYMNTPSQKTGGFGVSGLEKQKSGHFGGPIAGHEPEN